MSRPTRRQAFGPDELLATFSIRMPVADKRLLEEKARRDRVSLGRLVSSWLKPHIRGLRGVPPEAERLAS